MLRFKNYSVLILVLISMLLSATVFFGNLMRKKIVYVRSQDLVYGYLGMKEAQREFQERSTLLRANIDTLQKDFQFALSSYTSEVGRLSKEQKSEREKYLRSQQENLISYSKSINENIKREDEKITEGVLNQINSYVEDYGKKNDYDIILGTTLSGSLLYGEESMDVTQEILDALNKNYKDYNVKEAN
jgi:outer membrane protein